MLVAPAHDAVAQAAPRQLLTQRSAVVATIGIDRAAGLEQQLRRHGHLLAIGGRQQRAPDQPGTTIHRDMHLVAEGEAPALVARAEARVGIAWADLVFGHARPARRARHDRGIDQRPLLHRQTPRLELRRQLGEQTVDQPIRPELLAKAPDRRMVRRLVLARQPREAQKADPVEQRRLHRRVRQPVPALQQHDLEHHQRRIRGFPLRRTVNILQHRFEPRPVHQRRDFRKDITMALATSRQRPIEPTQLANPTPRHATLLANGGSIES